MSEKQAKVAGRRIYIAIAVVLFLVGLGFLLNWVVQQYPKSAEPIVFAGFVIGTLIISTALLRYLGDDVPRTLFEYIAAATIEIVSPRFLRLSRDDLALSRRLREREYEIQRLYTEFAIGSSLNQPTQVRLNDSERAELVAALTEQIKTEAGLELLSAMEAKYATALEQSAYLQDLRARFERTRVRLLTEVDALSRRSNLNLVIGTMTTVAAVALLTYIVLSGEVVIENWQAVLPGYLLRLSLVIFIEVFAFFFLRMYRSNLQDIKYFQNELTNIESKFVALEASLIYGGAEGAGKVIAEISQTERNYVLKSGESTLEIERLRIENSTLKSALDAFSVVFKKQQ